VPKNVENQNNHYFTVIKEVYICIHLNYTHNKPTYLTCYDNKQMYTLLYNTQDSWIFQISPKTCTKTVVVFTFKTLKPSNMRILSSVE